jgi:hypothetical protein
VAIGVGLEGVDAAAGADEARHPAREQAHRRPRVDDHVPLGDERLDEAQGCVAAPVRAPQQLHPGRAVGPADGPRGQQPNIASSPDGAQRNRRARGGRRF